MCPVCRMLLERAIRSAIKSSVSSSWHFISTYYRRCTVKITSYILESLASNLRCDIVVYKLQRRKT